MVKEKAICRHSNYCEIEGDIRIEAHSSTIYIVTSNSTNSWIIKPNPRKGTSKVKNWTITHKNDVAKCTQNHTLPVMGDSPETSSTILQTSFSPCTQPPSLSKRKSNFSQKILFMFTRYTILDLERETSETHYYNKLIVGLKFHKELITDPSEFGPSMPQFRG
ncbi:hypothetical protein ACS0TY_031253 [Phlomoides rotata]